MANDREQAQGRELSRAHRTARELSPLFRLRITNCERSLSPGLSKLAAKYIAIGSVKISR